MARLLILPQPHKPRMPQVTGGRPLHELKLAHQHRLWPSTIVHLLGRGLVCRKEFRGFRGSSTNWFHSNLLILKNSSASSPLSDVRYAT